MVRVGPLAHVAALARRHAREMDFTGRPLRGYVFVARKGLRTHQAVRSWVERGMTFAQSLPPKSPPPSQHPPGVATARDR